jgi:hypothetical protein
MKRLGPLTATSGLASSRNSLYFSLLAGNLGGEGFARDCVLRQQVSTAEKPCGFPLKIAENPRNSACFALKPDSERVSCWSQKASFAALFSGGLKGGPV